VRILLYAALVCAMGCVTSRTGGGPTTPTSTTLVPTRTNPTVGPDPSPISDGVVLDCGWPIDTLPAPVQGYSAVLDAIAFDTRILQADDGGGNDPHRLFAKTGLLVHAGRTASLAVAEGWTDRVSIAWGNHAAEWTTTLHIPACPATPAGEDRWLVYPGGFSLDTPACIPLQVRTGDQVTTIHVAVGAPCGE
jgi:hypothetical protein